MIHISFPLLDHYYIHSCLHDVSFKPESNPASAHVNSRTALVLNVWTCSFNIPLLCYVSALCRSSSSGLGFSPASCVFFFSRSPGYGYESSSTSRFNSFCRSTGCGLESPLGSFLLFSVSDFVITGARTWVVGFIYSRDPIFPFIRSWPCAQMCLALQEKSFSRLYRQGDTGDPCPVS